jgi:hypothetical protein
LLIDLHAVRWSLYSASTSAKRIAAGVTANGNGQSLDTITTKTPIDVDTPKEEVKKSNQTNAILFLSRLGQCTLNVMIFVVLLVLLLGLCMTLAIWFGWS